MFTHLSSLNALRLLVSNRKAVLSILAAVSLTATISLSLRLVQSAPAAPASPTALLPPTVTLDVPGEVLIGEDFEFEVRFKHTPGSSTGYAPYIDLYLPASGADGNSGGKKCDGISFLSAQTLFTSPPTVTLPTAYDSGINALSQCPGSYTTHPFASGGATVDLSLTPQYQLVVLALPFGSFDPTQPEVIVRVKAHVSDFADVEDQSTLPTPPTPLTIYARGGFRYGTTATDTNSSVMESAQVSQPTTPTLFKLKKEYLGREDEAVSGPNFVPYYPLKYKLTADIADTQKIDNLVLTDNLPPNLQFAGNVMVTIHGINAISVLNLTSCSGNPLEVVIASPLLTPPQLSVTLCSSITGSTTPPDDVVVTFDFFIPDVDANGQIIINKDCSNAPVDVKNDILATGDWVPRDPRDPAAAPGTAVHLSSDLFKVDHLLKAKCLAIQKSVPMIQEWPGGEIGPTPGDILRYELEFQVSDYFTIGQLVVTDFLADGQDLEMIATGTQPPTFTVTDLFGTTGSTTSTTFPAVSVTSIPNAPVPGFCPASFQSLQQPQIGTILRFDVSSAMFNLPSTIPRHSAGILTGGYAASLPPIGTAATGTIVFYAKIRDTFRPPVSTPHEFVDKHDPINNCVQIEGAVYDNVPRPNPINANTNIPTMTLGKLVVDTSAVQTIIVSGTLTKEVYAVKRGSTFTCGPTGPVCSNLPGLPEEVRPGDEVTFRIVKTIPSSDTERLTIRDWLPLPVFNAALSPPSGVVVSCTGVPAPGVICFKSPDDTLSSLVAPNFMVALANSISIDYGTFNDQNNQAGTIDLLFTSTVTNLPFADNLFLTNEVREREFNSFGASFDQVSIAQVNLREPKLVVRKAVVATDNPNALFIPAPPAPPGVTFDLGGFVSGPIDSSTVALIDSNVANVDANDTVTFAITIENKGGHPAFDLNLEDIIPHDISNNPTCFTVDMSSIQVKLGSGLPVLNSILPTIQGGFTLSVPGPIDELNPITAASGANIIVVTFKAKLKADITPGCCDNKAQIKQYASIAGGPDFVSAGFNGPYADLAEVCTKPTLTKSVVATSEAHTVPQTSLIGTPQVAIGEIVRYRLEVRLPEGSSPNFQITDTLPPGMKFLDGGTARLAFVSNGAGITHTGSGFSTSFDLVGNAPPTSAILTTLPPVNPGAITGGAGCGDPVIFSLGNVQNNDNDPDLEYVVIEFNALVCNMLSNQESTPPLPNTFSVSVNNSTIITSPPIYVIVVEPNLTIAKTVSPTTVIQGTTVTYTVTITNSSPVNAFDVQFSDALPLGLTFVPLSVTVTGFCLPLAGISIGAPLVTCAEIPVGGVVTITYQALAFPYTCPVTLTNHATVTWTSLPGLNGTTPNSTMSSTPGNSGATYGERDGSSPPLNDYVASASAPLTVLCPPCAKAPPDMVAWWPLDEPNGSTVVNDIAGVNNQGKPTPGITLGSLNAPNAVFPGFVAGAVNFPSKSLGTGPHIEVPDDSEINFGTGDLSIDSWVFVPRPQTAGVYTHPIVDKLQAGPAFAQFRGYAFYLVSSSTGARLEFEMGGGGPLSTYPQPGGQLVPFDQWTHVAVTVKRSSGLVTFYVNGASVATTDPLMPAGSLTNTVPLLIGEIRLTNSQAAITIDELEMFNRELTLTEVQSIYNAFSAGKCKCPPITLNPPAGALPSGVVNIPYSQTFTATGGCSSSSFTYSVTGGALPPGLTLSANGVLSGTPKQPGVFTFTITATDKCGCSKSQTYTLTVDCPMVPLPIFNTGVADDGSLLASGAKDLHYKLVSPSPVLPDAIVTQIPSAYLANGPNSQWIGPDVNPLSNSPAGFYTYRVTFNMPAGADLSTAIIAGQWASDNEAEIILNTSLTGVTIGTGITIGPNAFGTFTPFVITGPFMQGLNTLDFVVHNRELQTGLRVEMNGSVRCCPVTKADKCVITTSELHTMPANSNNGTPQVTIGEIIRYRLTATLPQGASPSFRFTDHLPPGLTYLGNPKVAFVSTGGAGTITSTAFSGAGLNLNASSVGACSGPPTTFILPASQVTGGAFSSGTDPTFNLGTLTNTHNDPNLEYVILEFNALINNLPVNTPGLPNQNGATLSNFYDVFSGSLTSLPIATSTPTNVTIVEPHLDVQKTVTATPGTSQAVFKVTMTNTGTATAFDVKINDVVPAGLIVLSTPAPSVSVSPASCSQPAVSVNGNTLTLTAPTMPVGCTVTLTFTVDVSSSCPETNIAQVTYTSLPGGSNSTPVGTQPNSTGSVTPGPTGADNGDRVYTASAQASISGVGGGGPCKPSCACPLKISRFRENGPNGTGDEFVEIFNPSDSDVLVSTCSEDPNGASNGIGVFVSSGNGTHPIFGQVANVSSLACQIPGSTVIPSRGYYLCGGKDYSLGGLGNNGATSHSVPDQTIGAGNASTGTTDIPDDAGLALLNIGSNIVTQCVIGSLGCPCGFNFSDPGGGGTGNAKIFDKVGFQPYGPGSPINISPPPYPLNIYPSLAAQYCEGTLIPSGPGGVAKNLGCLQPVGDASVITKGAGVPCPPTITLAAGVSFPVLPGGDFQSSNVPLCYGESGQYEFLRRQTTFSTAVGTLHQDTDNNPSDFILVAPNPSTANVGQTVTALSVTSVLGGAGPYNTTAPPDIPAVKFSKVVAAPSLVTPFPDPGVVNNENNPLGTFTIRYKFTNTSGGPINGVRFKVDSLTTLCGKQIPMPNSVLSVAATGNAQNLLAFLNCGVTSGPPTPAILKALNSKTTANVGTYFDGLQTFLGTVVEDLSVGSSAAPLSPFAGGVDSSFVLLDPNSTSPNPIGDGATGGQGTFNLPVPVPNNGVLYVQFKFGIVRNGVYQIFVTPMAF